VSVKLGYQIPNFSYGGSAAEIFPAVLAQAQNAEAAGFDSVFVMDHLYQLPQIGDPDEPMLEAYTLLGAIAAATERVQLSTLVTSNTYRNPALLAKVVTTLDVVSGGRALCALGAGWFESEHEGYGYEFGDFTSRFERLAEALEIVVPMLRGGRPTFAGKYYQVKDAINEPRLRDDIPVLIGGAGERKTFGLAVRHADHLNLVCGASELPHKLDALHQRLAEAGRDPTTLEVSYFAQLILDEDGERARQLLRDQFARRGIDFPALSEAERLALTDRTFAGNPVEVSREIKTRVLDHGVDRLVVNLVANGHEPGAVELAGATLRPLLSDEASGSTMRPGSQPGD
jgi:F420-dependent oxidoreductase-like protein